MNKKIRFLASFFIALTLMLGGVHEAQAKRMGGGKSFGSRPSYSEPYQRSMPPSPTAQPTRSAAAQQAATQNQAARQSWAGRGGLMGMLGGLALGGLLGSLFFGGAFENFNLMDLLVFAGIAYLLYRLFAAKATSRGQALGNAYGRSSYREDSKVGDYRNDQSASSGASGFDTDVLFDKGKSSVYRGSETTPVDVPAGFDRQAFLAGAENAYRYLQTAWDNRDLAAIRGLTTDKVFAEIQDQLRASEVSNKTEVLKLGSELLEVREIGSELEATVMFDCLLSEDGGRAEQVKEVWHFTKPVSSKQPKWFLDGIQQIEG